MQKEISKKYLCLQKHVLPILCTTLYTMYPSDFSTFLRLDADKFFFIITLFYNIRAVTFP